VYPAQIEHRIDLPNQMIRRHHPVEIKRVKELALPNLSLTIMDGSRESPHL
jgi:hypothetical protein